MRTGWWSGQEGVWGLEAWAGFEGVGDTESSLSAVYWGSESNGEAGA